MEYGRVYSEKKKMPKKPMERIYVMLFFVCMVLFVIIISNNMQTEKHKNIFYYNGEKVKLTNEIEREKKNETQKDEYVYFITMADIKNIFDIDKGAEDEQMKLEAEKQKLLLDRKERLNVIDEEYNKVLEEEQENLKLYLSKIEHEDKDKLEEYNKKSLEIKNVFEDKKENLVKNIASSLLESGEFYGE